MLGALAIISAILIVLADRDKKNNTPVEQTITDTVTRPDAAVRADGLDERPVHGYSWRSDWQHPVDRHTRGYLSGEKNRRGCPRAPDPYDEMPR